VQPHYRDPLPLGDPGGLPYSKGMMARALVSAGVGIVSAYEIATRLELELLTTGTRATELERLEQTAADVLGELEGARIVTRLRRLEALEALDKPILLLVGGATGTGKSTVATESAHRLGITRVTSTDFIRQTIRAYFPPSEMPAVHASSFESGGIEGFLEQSRQVLVGVEASIERAMTEGWSMAIEGVHLVPGMVPAEVEGALFVHAVLHVSSIDEHRSHFVIRDSVTGGTRSLDKYIDGLEEIRVLQELIAERAAERGVPVIESTTLEHATGELLDLVLAGSEQLAASL
jgi:2-phosphoglycerate kinase